MFNLETLIQKEENRALEFKEEFPKKLKLIKTIIAFANGSGGIILIGIKDKTKDIIGIQDDPLLMEEKIQNIVFDNIKPIVIPHVSILNHKNKIILAIKINSGDQKPYFQKSKGLEEDVYIRIGSTNRIADQQMIDELSRRARNISYDSIIDYTISTELLSLEILNDYIKKRNVDLSCEYETFEKIGLAEKTNEHSHPSIAGVLFFSNNYPEKYSSYFIKLAVFSDTTRKKIEKQKQFDPPLLSQLENAFELCKFAIPSSIELKDLEQKIKSSLPFEIVREALINAVCHRDYSIVGSGIQIHIFSDRIEIINPGVLPGDLTIEDLGKGISEVRNRQIVKIFRELGYIEQLGSGITRMFEICKETGLEKPKFEEIGNYFKVTFYYKKENFDILYRYIQKNKVVKINELTEKFQMHRNTIRSYLNKLINKNLIIREGKGPQTRYKLK